MTTENLTFCVTLQARASAADLLSTLIWEEEGILGIQESPVSGASLFGAEGDFEVLEFGTEAAIRCAEWLERENFRGDAELLFVIHLSSGPSFDAASLVARLSAKLQSPVHFISSEILRGRDYLLEYQKNTKGIRIGNNLWVGPPWDQAPAGADAFIVEPGLAFGTGDHPTTQLCLEALEEISDQSLHTIIDVGTGSGILAAAARRFFPKAKIYVTDLDPLCMAEFEKTFQLNGLSTEGIECFFGEQSNLDQLIGRGVVADLVISNIYAEVLAILSPQVLKLLTPQSRWILSGVLQGPSEQKLIAAIEDIFLCKERRSRTRMHSELSSAGGLEPKTENWVYMELRKKS